jgi:hypothetical protein
MSTATCEALRGEKEELYKRPPVPSAQESALAGWLAPVIAVVLGIVLRGNSNPIVAVALPIICGVIVLFGLTSSVWSLYVGWFHGPRRHLFPATAGLVLDTLWILLFVNAVTHRDLLPRTNADVETRRPQRISSLDDPHSFR